MPILQAKLRPPELPPCLSLPTAAWEALLATATEPVSLLWLCAPAGAGKTTLWVHWTRWLQEQQRAWAWLSLDARDRRPRRLAQHLLATLQRLCPGGDQRWLQWLETTEQDDGDFLLAALEGQSQELLTQASDSPPAVLLLEDLHVLEDSDEDGEALTLLVAWLELLQKQGLPLQVCLSSRSLPVRFPLSRWLLYGGGRIREIPAHSLELGRPELNAFFAAQCPEVPLSELQLRQLQHYLGGWPLPYQLFGLLWKTGLAFPVALEQLKRHAALQDYLEHEIRPALAAAQWEFLLLLACAESCDLKLAETLMPEGARYLRSLQQQTPFLWAQNETQGVAWALQPLLRETLQAQCTPTELASLHARLARALLQVQRYEAALEQARAAHDPALLAACLEPLAAAWLGQGRVGELRSVLAELPPVAERETISAGLSLSLLRYQIWVDLLTGDLNAGQERLAWLEHQIHRQEPQAPPLLPEAAAQIANLKGMLARRRGDAEGVLHWSREALATQTQDPFVLAAAWFNLGLAEMMLRHYAEAEKTLQEAARWNRLAGNRVSHYAARVCQARLYLQQGELDTARQAFHEIRAAAQRDSLQQHSLLGTVAVDLARIAYEKNDLASCEKELAEGLELTRFAYNSDASYGLIQGLQLRLDARQFEAAEGLLKQAREFCREHGSRSLAEALDALEMQGRLLQGQSPSSEPEHPWNRFFWARLQGKTAQALSHWDGLEAQANRHSDRLELIRLLVLRADEAELGLSFLRQALTLAARCGSVRSLLDPASPQTLRHLPALLRESFTPPLSLAYRQALEQALAERGVHSESETLSERELEILDCLARGLRNQQIQAELFISQNTIKTHLKNLYRKLEVSSRSAAVARAREQGLI